MNKFDVDDIEAISKAIGETMNGSQITTMFKSLGLKNFDSERPFTSTKWRRINESVIDCINFINSNKILLDIIEYAAKPSKWVTNLDDWGKFKREINSTLIFHEMELSNNGKIKPTKPPVSAKEANERLNSLVEKLNMLSVHDNVMKFAKSELLQDNFFHAILESSKGVLTRVREISELQDDGTKLIDKAFSRNHPLVLIKGNFLRTPSEISVYTGLANLLKAITSMYRNPTAHDPKLYDENSLQDAIDAFIVMSVAHRQLDKLINVRDVGTH